MTSNQLNSISPPSNGTLSSTALKTLQNGSPVLVPEEKPVPSLANILENLRKPIPKRFLKTKTLQGKQIPYCPGYRVNKILDFYTAGRWHYEVSNKLNTTSHILVTVRIMIVATDASVYREGTGIEALDKQAYGDPQSNAESMAFRRAAARFGLGLHLYEKEE